MFFLVARSSNINYNVMMLQEVAMEQAQAFINITKTLN